MNTRQKVEIDASTLQATLEDVIKRIHDEADPAELDLYRKLFRKTVPFFLRSYVAAYLLRQGLHRGPRRKPGQVATLFVSIGKNRRVFPRDLVLFFVNGAQIGKGDLGDIKILDNYSFVEVEENLAASVIGRLDGANFRGRRITVNFAKKRNGEPSGYQDEQQEEEQLASVED